MRKDGSWNYNAFLSVVKRSAGEEWKDCDTDDMGYLAGQFELMLKMKRDKQNKELQNQTKNQRR